MSPDPVIDLVRATVALFIIVDPIGLVPIFSNVTGTMGEPDRSKMFRVVIYTGASLLTIFALVGQELLALFGISLPSFDGRWTPPAPPRSRHTLQRREVRQAGVARRRGCRPDRIPPPGGSGSNHDDDDSIGRL